MMLDARPCIAAKNAAFILEAATCDILGRGIESWDETMDESSTRVGDYYVILSFLEMKKSKTVVKAL